MYIQVNGIPIVLNPAWEYHEQYQCRPAYPRNTEPKYMVMTPDIERYFRTLEGAKRYLTDRRRVKGLRRRCARRARENGIPF